MIDNEYLSDLIKSISGMISHHKKWNSENKKIFKPLMKTFKQELATARLANTMLWLMKHSNICAYSNIVDNCCTLFDCSCNMECAHYKKRGMNI